MWEKQSVEERRKTEMYAIWCCGSPWSVVEFSGTFPIRPIEIPAQDFQSLAPTRLSVWRLYLRVLHTHPSSPFPDPPGWPYVLSPRLGPPSKSALPATCTPNIALLRYDLDDFVSNFSGGLWISLWYVHIGFLCYTRPSFGFLTPTGGF